MKPTAQPYICDLSPYQPGLPIDLVARKYGLAPKEIIKLASNENPLGMSPKARAAVERLLPEAYRYPEQHNLTQALSKKLQVSPESIVLGNGSNDVLDLIARCYLGASDDAVSSQYAFAIYAIATQSAGAKNTIVPATDYGHDLGAMLAAITPATKIVWIANPNNPTGTFIGYKKVEKFLASVPERVIVVLDEAYNEYLDAKDVVNAIRWVDEHPNLVVVRTFSKIYGLAGMRIGYGVAAPAVAELLNRVRQPFNVNMLALAAATAALEDDEFVARSATANRTGRAQLLARLDQLGLECLPAYGNFVSFKVAQAAQINEQLLGQGVIVRPLAGYGMSDWLRVTVGLPRDNERFLATLKKLLR